MPLSTPFLAMEAADVKPFEHQFGEKMNCRLGRSWMRLVIFVSLHAKKPRNQRQSGAALDAFWMLFEIITSRRFA